MGPLLPTWLELIWTAAYLCVAASHLRHMAQSLGQRRAWHSCHVLMALGMACMYLPAALLPGSCWQLIFALAGTLTALWALGSNGSIIWLLTALDLGVMLLMWSPTGATGPLVWFAITYLVLETGLWLGDIYSRLDRSRPAPGWRLLSDEGSGLTLSTERGAGSSLLGGLDITASMVVMSLGMAYMLVAMLVI